MQTDKQFIAYFYCNGFNHISLGIHLDWTAPNMEIHFPFGFFRIGWQEFWPENRSNNLLYRSFGLTTQKRKIKNE